MRNLSFLGSIVYKKGQDEQDRRNVGRIRRIKFQILPILPAQLILSILFFFLVDLDGVVALEVLVAHNEDEVFFVP